jgi:hypothetical protein
VDLCKLRSDAKESPMTTPSQSELDQINADRARMFTATFWKSLLQGRDLR